METLFLSDLHLSPDRPDRLEDFKNVLKGPARRMKAVYLLGDLSEEFWVGNDDTTPPNQEIINELLEFTRQGIPLYFIRGNRDLLLDENFTRLTGVTVLPDRSVIDLDGKRVLIMHGDLLCTGDRTYQWFRHFMVNPVIMKLVKRLPYRFRIRLSHGIRPAMSRSAMQKPDAIMDVDPSAVIKDMQAHKVTELIHGHTHRPGIHEFQVNNTSYKRIVLGGWYDEAQVLVCENAERKLIPVSDYLRDYNKPERFV